MKLYEWLLRRFPDDFRREHERELCELIERERASLPKGLVPRARFWLSTASDLLRAARRLRRDDEKVAGAPRRMISDRIRRWGDDVRHGVRALLAVSGWRTEATHQGLTAAECDRTSAFEHDDLEAALTS